MTARSNSLDTDECVGDFLDRAVDLTARFLADRADLSASAAFVLNRLCREGNTRLTSLAVKEGVSQPSMTQLIQRLERQDLVVRLADPDDRRATLVGVTAHGRDVLDDRRRRRRGRLSVLMETLSPQEREALWQSVSAASPVLEKLTATAEQWPCADSESDDRRKVLG